VPILALAALCGAAALGACGDDAASPDDGAALSVVATTSVVGDFARQVGGNRVAVDVIVGPNVSAHDFEPAPSDLEAIRRADVVVRNGAGLEAWFDDTIEASGTHAVVVDASAGLELRTAHGGDDHVDDDGHDHGDADPHVWQDPRNAVRMVDGIRRAFADADPDGAAAYEANAARYTEELERLDAEIAAQTATLPVKKLVTNHDAFGYYAARYGFTIVGSVIPSFDSSAELSGADVRDLVRAIEAERVPAVFSETSLPGDAARTIAEEAGVAVVEGDDALYGDGLGPEGSDGATYLDMMRHNTRTIVANLRADR
jgi:zinc/manganese transport system substrate-binding protein/manganese/iron transport system substrate-binding protein